MIRNLVKGVVIDMVAMAIIFAIVYTGSQLLFGSSADNAVIYGYVAMAMYFVEQFLYGIFLGITGRI